MKYYINKINSVSVFKTAFAIFFTFGLILDILIVSYFGTNMAYMPRILHVSDNFYVFLYFLFSFAVSIGFLFGFIAAFFSIAYNITSGFSGGVKICVSSEFEREAEKPAFDVRLDEESEKNME